MLGVVRWLEWFRSILCGKFDEFSEYGYAFAEAGAVADFGDDPKLDFVETSDEDVQVRGYLAEVVASEGVVEQLVLVDAPEQIPVEEGHVISQLLRAEHLDICIDALRWLLLFRQTSLKNAYYR